MAWVAVAIGGASLISGVAGSVMSADAQQSAADTAAASQQSANDQNYKMYQQSRGSDGSAVLPLYMKNPDGSLFEKSLSNDLVSGYNGSFVPLSSFQAATDPLKPALAGATKSTNDIFNGGITNTMLSNTAPVRAARLATARSTSLDALNKTLSDINATQAGHGFGGDSFGGRALEFTAAKSAGESLGAAGQQNAQEVADTRNYGNVTLPLQNLQAPGAVAGESNQMAFLPQSNWLNSLSQRMQPLNELRIGTAQPYQYQPLPTPSAAAYMGGANALSAAGGSISNGLGAYMQQRNYNSLLNSFQANSGNATTYNAYANPGTPQMYAYGSGAPAGTSVMVDPISSQASSFAPGAATLF